MEVSIRRTFPVNVFRAENRFFAEHSIPSAAEAA
jgi:hypothetical protein